MEYLLTYSLLLLVGILLCQLLRVHNTLVIVMSCGQASSIADAEGHTLSPPSCCHGTTAAHAVPPSSSIWQISSTTSTWLSVVLGALASPCCLLPLVPQLLWFGTLGASSISTFVHSLQPYRLYFVGLSVLLLSLRVRTEFRRPPRQRKWTQVGLQAALSVSLNLASRILSAMGETSNSGNSDTAAFFPPSRMALQHHHGHACH